MDIDNYQTYHICLTKRNKNKIITFAFIKIFYREKLHKEHPQKNIQWSDEPASNFKHKSIRKPFLQKSMNEHYSQ